MAAATRAHDLFELVCRLLDERYPAFTQYDGWRQIEHNLSSLERAWGPDALEHVRTWPAVDVNSGDLEMLAVDIMQDAAETEEDLLNYYYPTTPTFEFFFDEERQMAYYDL